MDNPSTPPWPDPSLAAGHETTDANPFYIGVFGTGLAVLVCGAMAAMSGVFWHWEGGALRHDLAQPAMANDQTPPEPRLQVDEAAQIAELRAEEAKTLSTYAWVDPQKKIVRIPVDRAVEILAERGFPESQTLPSSKQQDKP